MAQICVKKARLLHNLLLGPSSHGGHFWRKVCRCIYSETGIWEPYSPREVEAHWNKKIQDYTKKLAVVDQNEKEKFYVLSMFPYPSGKLHMGHVRVYTISDAVAHFHRMNGKQVLHPIGWDAFGLPAENAAIERGLQADEWTYSNIAYMRKQLKDLGMCFNWEREVTTCSPDYYRWTQYLFVKMFKAGLAYQKEAVVNWDPVDQTVLANEQVDESGCSWRSGAKVEKRLLKQWFLKQQHYNKALVESLADLPDWPDGVRSMQANWIGDCDGCTFNFNVQTGNSSFILPIHTPSPELIYGAAYIALAPYHTLLAKSEFLDCLSVDVKDEIKELEVSQQDINLQIHAIHPITSQTIPIFVTNDPAIFIPEDSYIESQLGIPCASDLQASFAKKNGIEFVPVLKDEDVDGGVILNSEKLSGLSRAKGRSAILEYVKKNDLLGEAWTSPRQHDWLVSRQRYWGTPIPIIHCPKCKAVPVPECDLPVILPKLKISGKGLSPLLEAKDWLNIKCPQCNEDAKRETDTMDTFVDSAWYFLRYTDAHNEKEPFDKEKADQLMPVDMYVGGLEHALLHLLYARFFNHFIHDQNMVSHKEPFKRLLVQGLVKGQSYRVASTGQYLAPSQVDFSGDEPVAKETGEKLIVKYEKMSKSKHNGVNPEELLAKYGADAVRIAVLSNMPPKQDYMWDEKDLSDQWVLNMWSLVSRYIQARHEKQISGEVDMDLEKVETEIKTKCNETINLVANHYQSKNTTLNEAIKDLISLTNMLTKTTGNVIGSSAIFERALCSLCIMLAPFVPHVASEMWRGIGSVCRQDNSFDMKKDVLEQNWPTQMDSDVVQLIIKINNETIGRIPVAVEHQQNQQVLQKFAMESALGQEHLVDANIRRVIHKADVRFKGASAALLNFVVAKDKMKTNKSNAKES